MKPTLQFRLSQHLTLTPQLQQSIRLLQFSTIELNQEIERLLMENPILEREDGETDAAAAVAGQAEAAHAAPGRSRTRAIPARSAATSATPIGRPIFRPTMRRPGAARTTAAAVATTMATGRRRRPTCPPCATTSTANSR